MKLNDFEKKKVELNAKFVAKFVKTPENTKLSSLERFFLLHEMNFVLFVISIAYFFVISSLFESSNFLSLIAIGFGATIFASIFYAFKFVKPLLLDIPYKGYERHLFSKYIALQELLLTTAIAFLIGILPVYSDFSNLDKSSTQYLVSNMIAVWFTCVAGGQKCMLEHTRNVWIANNRG